MSNLLILIHIILVSVDINITNFTENIFRYAFNPYISIFGNFTWGIIFGFIGAGLFIASRSTATAFTYLVLIGLVFGVLLPEALVGIFGMIVAFIAAAAFYVILVESR